jgi:CPA2 family monovalent cation:H+ antiporter-2
MESPQGRTALAVLIYQDLMVVPMMLLIPVLAGTGGTLGGALAGFGVKVVGILVTMAVLARFVVPKLLERVVQTQSRDLFLLSIVAICLVVAWASAEAGLSLALGAFLAGLIVSESEYSHQALADVIPFRDLFAAFFFVSIGMLLDVGLAVGNPGLLVGLVGGVLTVKAMVAGAAALILGVPLRSAVLVGLALSQVGEFSFILADSGLQEGLLEQTVFEWFLVVAVVTMSLTAFLMSVGPRLAEALTRLPLPGRLGTEGFALHLEDEEGRELKDHVVVVGFGVNGRNVTWAAKMAGIHHVVVDINPGLVRDEQAKGVPIHFGDATQAPVLEFLCVGKARAVIVVIGDAATTRRVTAQARMLNPGCYIIVRTRYTAEVEPLTEAGADLVIPEELETSVEIVSRMLGHYLVPKREVEAFVGEIRSGGYEMLRSLAQAGDSLASLRLTLADVEISTLIVDKDCPIDGRALGDTELRRLYGITVVAVRRGDALIPNPGADDRILCGDALIVLGLADEIAAASALFQRSGSEGGVSADAS